MTSFFPPQHDPLSQLLAPSYVELKLMPQVPFFLMDSPPSPHLLFHPPPAYGGFAARRPPPPGRFPRPIGLSECLPGPSSFVHPDPNLTGGNPKAELHGCFPLDPCRFPSTVRLPVNVHFLVPPPLSGGLQSLRRRSLFFSFPFFTFLLSRRTAVFFVHPLILLATDQDAEL